MKKRCTKSLLGKQQVKTVYCIDMEFAGGYSLDFMQDSNALPIYQHRLKLQLGNQMSELSPLMAKLSLFNVVSLTFYVDIPTTDRAIYGI